jgi:4-hydroxy-2-oxoglutarate aldolase
MSGPFAGIYVALTTPFEKDEVSPPRIAANVERLNGTGLAGYLVLGSTGECVSLTDEESAALVRAVRRAAAPGKAVLAGTAREATRLTIDFTNRMADLGADAALVRPPAYFKSRMTREALRAHYLALADASRLPILIYNIPQNTGYPLDPELVVELSRHPNIRGLKESSADPAIRDAVIPAVAADFSFLLGAGGVFLNALERGARGAILAVANAAPVLCAKIFELFTAGRLEEARRRQLELVPLNKALVETHGIPGLKYAQGLAGYFGGTARLPLLPVPEAAKTEIRGLMEKLGLIVA